MAAFTFYTKANRISPKRTCILDSDKILANDVSFSGNSRLWIVGNEFGELVAVWAQCDQDALDEAIDSGLADGLLIDEPENPNVELAETIKNMPKTYETDGQGNNAIAYLHYFIGGFDWYITEKDAENPQHQAFGLACVQETELGYISIEELRKIKKGISVVELDFNWTPKTLAEIRKEKEI